MLCELYIENLAVIEKTNIQFDTGLNVFTGETGAGKSIVIDAINAVLGQRTSKEIVRYGTPKATITAVFTDISTQTMQALEKHGFDSDYVDEGQLIITREISADQKSIARIMGRPVTLAVLKEIGSYLINIHGQHDSQVLLSPDRHIDILDKYGDFSDVQTSYYNCYKRVVLIKKEMKRLSINESEKAQQIDLLNYQINEIIEADLKENEDAELEAKLAKIKNKTRIDIALKVSYDALNGADEAGAVELCRRANGMLLEVANFYEPAEKLALKIEELYLELDDLSSEIASQQENLDFEDSSINSLEARLDEIHKLKMKYGATIQEVLQYLENAQKELDSLELSEKKLIELNEEGTVEYKKLLSLGEKLRAKRISASKKFIKSVTEELQFLDMPNVKLDVYMEQTKPNAKGQDTIEFLISTNKGEPPKSIAKIASGGELSRIMLAIKNTLADKDEIQTLIFDEIDTGVSGRAAQKIGLKLHQAAKNRQVISVTHSAQIAALCDHHFLISKESKGEKTFTEVEKLDLSGRIHEVARIMSTDKITDLMLKNAEEMIANR